MPTAAWCRRSLASKTPGDCRWERRDPCDQHCGIWPRQGPRNVNLADVSRQPIEKQWNRESKDLATIKTRIGAKRSWPASDLQGVWSPAHRKGKKKSWRGSDAGATRGGRITFHSDNGSCAPTQKGWCPMRSASVVGWVLATALVTFVGGFSCGQEDRPGVQSEETGGRTEALQQAGTNASANTDADSQACGYAVGQSCCFPAGVCYRNYLICNGAQCIHCGAVGEPCCDGTPYYCAGEPGDFCNQNGICQPPG